MIDNPRGGDMTPEGNFAPAYSSGHEMCCGTPVNPSAGTRSSEAGAGPAGLSIILDLQSAIEIHVVIPHRTGIICKNSVAGIEGFLLPTHMRRFEKDTSPTKGLKLVGVTLGNLIEYQKIADQWIGNLTEKNFRELCPLSVEKMVSYLKTGLPIAEQWIPFQVLEGAPSPFFAPFAGKTAILVY